MREKLNVISLFAGAGGLDISICSTGSVRKILSTDANNVFLDTTSTNLNKHFPDVLHEVFAADARKLNGSLLIDRLGSSPDLLMGGPPCDDFTHCGLRRGMDGSKGPLIYEFLRIVGEARPRAFLFENVPNLAQQFKNVFSHFLKVAEEIGYSVKWKLLHAPDFGAPTSRKRVFVVGWSEQSNCDEYCFPEATHFCIENNSVLSNSLKPYVTVGDVLGDLPDVNESTSHHFNNHVARVHRKKTIELIKTVQPAVRFRKSYRYRAPWDGLCQSLTAGSDNSTKAYIHPVFHREMTVREYARIHCFPDSWIFAGTLNNGIKQVANSVPVPLGNAVLKSIVKILSIGEFNEK